MDRNANSLSMLSSAEVALRKESVDRNLILALIVLVYQVALRKESVDRNSVMLLPIFTPPVALRKESVDRNAVVPAAAPIVPGSLSARRAWIEILGVAVFVCSLGRRSPQGERG